MAVPIDGEVAVVGLGSMGSMVLWRLAERGLKAVGFEQFELGNNRGAAGGGARMFRTAYFEGEGYVPLLRESRSLWDALEDASQRRLCHWTGGVMMGPADSMEMSHAMAGVSKYRIRHDWMTPEEAMERFPYVTVPLEDQVLLDHEAGYIESEASILAANSTAQKLGATIHKNTEVESIEPGPHGFTVRAGGTAYQFKKVIVAAGPWTSSILRLTDGQVDPHRRVSGWFAPPNGHDPIPADAPTFLSAGAAKFIALPLGDSQCLKLGVRGNATPIADVRKFSQAVNLDESTHLRAVINSHFRTLSDVPVRLCAYMEGDTISRAPLVGPSREEPDLIVLAGFSGQGFKFSPLVGDIAADFVLTGATRRALDSVKWGRISLAKR